MTHYSTIAGMALHGLGGMAAGSFYIPYKQVRGWAWESYWIVGGLFTWIVMPLVAAVLSTSDLTATLRDAPPSSLATTFVFGVLWGIGGLTFGLSLRYLGMSLGMAIALGTCAVFGTLIPPLYDGSFVQLVESDSGRIILAGLVVCVSGISICSLAGRRREREMPAELKAEANREANFGRGVAVAIVAGVMSACFALAVQTGKPIAEAALRLGTAPVHQNAPVILVLFWGGFLTNLCWCACLNVRNRTAHDYIGNFPLVRNYLFSAAAGTIAYLEFLFYGMGTTKMGRYDFSSWTIHMAFIIVFSNLWGLWFREWTGTSRATQALNLLGIGVLLVSTVVVGYGNFVTTLAPVPLPITRIEENRES